MSSLKNQISHRLGHSVELKVIAWAVFAAGIVIAASFSVELWIAEHNLVISSDTQAKKELKQAVGYLDDKFEGIEISGSQLQRIVSKEGISSKKRIVDILTSYVRLDPDIQGVAVGYKEDYFEGDPDGFAPYVMTVGDSIITMNTAKRYDYRHHSWYTNAKGTKKGAWGLPFRESNGTRVMGYSIPLISQGGDTIGAICLDLALDTIRRDITYMNPMEKSTMYVMDRNRRFIVHPDSSMLMNVSLDELHAKADFNPNESILIKIKELQAGVDSYNDGNEDVYIYHAPAEHAQLTVAMALPASEVKDKTDDIRRHMLISALCGILIMALVLALVLRKQLRPIAQYSAAAQSIAKGNFNTELPEVHQRNEFYLLGRSLDTLQKSLNKYIAELSTTMQEKGKIENELHVASAIQKAMLPQIYPPFPDRTDIDIYGTLVPAKEVGGDLYDFFINDERLFFCIGDVSGKGVPASLVMAVTRSLLRIVAVRENEPARILSALNDSMSQMNETCMFVTMFMGVLDLPSGKLLYSNAGHNAPFIVDTDGNVTMLHVDHNLPLAVLESTQYTNEEIQLAPGSTIFLYTDGLTEAENTDKELLGEEKSMALVGQNASASARDMVNNIIEEIKHHANGAEQSDDITLLTIKYNAEKSVVKERIRLQLLNNISEVSRLEAFSEQVGELSGLDMSATMQLNLAIEEAVSNVILYAYPEGQSGLIDLDAIITDKTLKIIITDSGKPFNPTIKSDPDITQGAEDRAIGGLGIMLIRKLMDAVNYERIDGRNVLTLSKRLQPTSA